MPGESIRPVNGRPSSAPNYSLHGVFVLTTVARWSCQLWVTCPASTIQQTRKGHRLFTMPDWQFELNEYKTQLKTFNKVIDILKYNIHHSMKQQTREWNWGSGTRDRKEEETKLIFIYYLFLACSTSPTGRSTRHLHSTCTHTHIQYLADLETDLGVLLVYSAADEGISLTDTQTHTHKASCKTPVHGLRPSPWQTVHWAKLSVSQCICTSHDTL